MAKNGPLPAQATTPWLDICIKRHLAFNIQCAPVVDCISEVNITQVDNVKDLHV